MEQTIAIAGVVATLLAIALGLSSELFSWNDGRFIEYNLLIRNLGTATIRRIFCEGDQSSPCSEPMLHTGENRRRVGPRSAASAALRIKTKGSQTMSDQAVVTTETQGHVFLMGLNRPEKLNAFNLAMLRELAEAYTHFERNPDLRCALLYAHGDNFTAGLDLAEVGPAVAGGQELFPEGSVDPLDLLEPRRTKPIICAVNGYCLTIGVELLLASDIRLAATGTTLRQMEVCRGIMPFGGATLRFPAVAGWGNAMRYLLTGDRFDADEALRIGIVQEVVDSSALQDRGLELATTVAEQAPLAVRQTRFASRVAVEEGREAALETLIGQARELMLTEDAREGVLSFVQRRKAEFHGQ